MASMDVEATAVIKKNSKNNNIKGCVKVTGEVTAAHPFCDMLLISILVILLFLLAESDRWNV